MKRYKQEYCSIADHEMQESPTGEYVLYSEIDKLIESFKDILYTVKSNGGDLFAKAIDEVEALKEMGAK